MSRIKECVEGIKAGILAALLALAALAHAAMATVTEAIGAAPWPRRLRALAADQRGTSSVEYAIVVVCVVVVGLAAAATITAAIGTELDEIESTISGIVT